MVGSRVFMLAQNFESTSYIGYNNCGTKRGQKYGRSRDRNPIKSQNRDYLSLEKLSEVIRARGERYLNMDNRAPARLQPLRGRRGKSVNRLWTRERRIPPHMRALKTGL